MSGGAAGRAPVAALGTSRAAPLAAADTLAWLGVGALALPAIGLLLRTDAHDLARALASPHARAALALSLQTSLLALGTILLPGLPLAWWLSRRDHPALLAAVELPVVLPPAVLGVALLESFGRNGLLGPPLAAVGVSLPFSGAAVVLAQAFVGAPYLVAGAAAAFRAVDGELLAVARTLGAGPLRAFLTVALPLAAPGVLMGAGLAWARALGEFGATLLFAGNLPGRTQTLPLAIYEALERDAGEARALSALLLALAAGALLGLRLAQRGSARGR